VFLGISSAVGDHERKSSYVFALLFALLAFTLTVSSFFRLARFPAHTPYFLPSCIVLVRDKTVGQRLVLTRMCPSSEICLRTHTVLDEIAQFRRWGF